MEELIILGTGNAPYLAEGRPYFSENLYVAYDLERFTLQGRSVMASVI